MRGWLVPRETQYSLGKEDADRRILLRTGECLTSAGHQVITVDPQALPNRVDVPEFVLSMSEERESLRTLQRLAECGSYVLNPPWSVWTACQRSTMLAALQRAAITVPTSRLVPTRPDGKITAPVWVKRPDYHRLREDDVSYAPTVADINSIFRRFAAAGIDAALVQAHCPGLVVKCYVVGTAIIHISPEPRAQLLAQLRDVCIAAGRALGLCVFGVDLVIGNELPVVIDVNDWPSFSPCCDVAAGAIARLVDAYGEVGGADE